MESVVRAGADQRARPIGQRSLLRPTRIDQAELLDLNAGSLDDVRANLNEMWLINRWMGGLGALTIHLLPRLRDATQSLTLLDLGTGGAEIPLHLERWAWRHQVNLRILGVDWSSRNLSIAGKNIRGTRSIQLLRSDALNLPLPENSVDYVVSSLFMHHFTSEELIDLLRKAYQCARRGIIMSDLVRGWLALAAFKLISPIFARNWLTRHDGALSIYRAYTPVELRKLACEAGLPDARVTSHWPFRMTLVAEK